MLKVGYILFQCTFFQKGIFTMNYYKINRPSAYYSMKVCKFVKVTKQQNKIKFMFLWTLSKLEYSNNCPSIVGFDPWWISVQLLVPDEPRVLMNYQEKSSGFIILRCCLTTQIKLEFSVLIFYIIECLVFLWPCYLLWTQNCL